MTKIVKYLITLLCIAGGIQIGNYFVDNIFIDNTEEIRTMLILFPGLILAIIGYSASPYIIRATVKIATSIITLLQKMPIQDLIGGTLGLIVALIIASFIGIYLSKVPYVGYILSVIIALFLGYIGMNVGAKKKEDLFNLQSLFKIAPKEKAGKGIAKANKVPMAKVLDTSVIIDGRIADVVQTGFLEGTLVIPNFVLEELRHIADSSDNLKRTKGRRGLDILNIIRKELKIGVEISEMDFPDLQEVDSKLVRMAQVMNGCVVTNDYNLNKVAELQGVKVLNVNDLANALKPAVIPGEEMTVYLVKEGKENNQGVAYLDDGTMIVVEDGKFMLEQTVRVVVTSALQTSAGRMIFARLKNGDE